MKNTKQLLILLLALVFIGGQVYYNLTIHPGKVSEFQATTTEVGIKEAELDKLTTQLANIEVARKELEGKALEVEGLKAKLPPYNTIAIHLLDMSRLMMSSEFQEVKITSNETTVQAVGEKNLKAIPYTLKYVTTYEKSKHFVENLRTAYQFLGITKLNISNSPQGDEEKTRLVDEAIKKQLVETTLDLTLLCDDVVTKDEIYHPTLNMLKNTEGVFESIKKPNKNKVEASSPTNESKEEYPIEQEEPINQEEPREYQEVAREEDLANTQAFSLDIYDILRSGDTYRFQGPRGEGGMGAYTGLVSEENVHITLNVGRQGYSIVLDDANGKREENKTEVKISEPSFIITSEAKQIQDKMPQIHITVRNTTGVIMPITIQGTLLENIHVYNSSGAKLSPGETSGNISLS